VFRITSVVSFLFRTRENIWFDERLVRNERYDVSFDFVRVVSKIKRSKIESTRLLREKFYFFLNNERSLSQVTYDTIRVQSLVACRNLVRSARKRVTLCDTRVLEATVARSNPAAIWSIVSGLIEADPCYRIIAAPGITRVVHRARVAATRTPPTRTLRRRVTHRCTRPQDC